MAAAQWGLRSVSSIPVESMPGIPKDASGRVNMDPKGRALYTTNRYPVVKTCIGRILDPNRLQEVTQACQDPKWLQALQRRMHKDEEYMKHCMEEGPTTMDLHEFKERHTFNSDHEFMLVICDEVTRNKALAIHFCTMIDVYMSILQKRDNEAVRQIAEGPTGQSQLNDAYKKHSGEFGVGPSF